MSVADKPHEAVHQSSPHDNFLLILTQLYAFNIDMSCGAHNIAVSAFSCLLLCKIKLMPEVVNNKSALTFKSLAVSLRTTRFNIKKFYMALTLHLVFLRISEQTVTFALYFIK